jgi:hypothetical protein
LPARLVQHYDLILLLHFDQPYIARNVTAKVVGSGVLFGGTATWIIKTMKGEGGGMTHGPNVWSERRGESSERDLEDSG